MPGIIQESFQSKPSQVVEGSGGGKRDDIDEPKVVKIEGLSFRSYEILI